MKEKRNKKGTRHRHGMGYEQRINRQKNLVNSGKASFYVPYRNGVEEACKAAGL